MSEFLLALPGPPRLLRLAHVFSGFLRVGRASPVVPIAGYARSLGVADLGASFRRHHAPSAMVRRVMPLHRLLKIAQSVIRRVLVDVMDDVAASNRVVRVGPVPYVDVPEDVPILVDRRVQVSFALGNPDENAAVASRLCPASPVVVAASSVRVRQFRARLCAGLANSVVVSALPGAELRNELGRVVAREVNAALGARGCGLHITDYTQLRMGA